MQRVLLLAVVLPVAVGASGSQAGLPAQVIDSAGVPIVTSERPSLPGSAAWDLDSVPLLRTGAVAGTKAETFHLVTHAARLSDGRLIVLNGSTKEVRYYSSAGSLEKSVGRAGAGPGDFRTFSGLQVGAADSVLVFDVLNSRASVFDAAGELARVVTFRLPEAGGSAKVLGRTGDGSFLAAFTRPAQWDRSKAGNTVYEETTVVRYDARGRIQSTVGHFDDTEMAVYSLGDGLHAMPPPLWRRALMTMTGDDLVVGHTRSFEIREISPEGAVLRIIRASIPALGVSDEDREPYATQASRVPQLRELLRQVDFPETHPSFKRILIDRSGNLWVEPYVRTGEDPTWAVFDPGGRWLTEVRVAAAFRPMEIGEDYVLGVWRDDLDVEYIDLRRLHKGRSAR